MIDLSVPTMMNPMGQVFQMTTDGRQIPIGMMPGALAMMQPMHGMQPMMMQQEMGYGPSRRTGGQSRQSGAVFPAHIIGQPYPPAYQQAM